MILILKKIISKPIDVILFKIKQKTTLFLFDKFSLWVLLKKKALTLSSDYIKNPNLIFIKLNLKKLNNEFYLTHERYTSQLLKKIKENKYKVFSHNIDSLHDWDKDWRYNHKWEKKYFKKYNFYEKNKKKYYDVKFPWELGRLSFLIPFAAEYALKDNKNDIIFIIKTLRHWKKNNPYTKSVQWNPMETSIRSINLIIILEILENATYKSRYVYKLITNILISNAFFLWETMEYTKPRGNHYIANITALLLISLKFNYVNKMKKIFKYCKKKIISELHNQYDGGFNVEKSIAYHRLVTELFILNYIALQRNTNYQITNKEKEIFKDILYFTESYINTNGISPNLGDNDSATLLTFDNLDSRDHRNIISLIQQFLDLPLSQPLFPSSLWLFSKKKAKKINKEKHISQITHFKKENILIAKNQKNYFFMDIGPNGLDNTGGHGHNDLFSFELELNNQPIIVDPGCYTYTGNLKDKNIARSTMSHNIANLNNLEIAKFEGYWNIKKQAIPKIEYLQTNKNLLIDGTFSHTGYQRLNQPATIKRYIQLNKNFCLTINDIYTSNSNHTLIQNFHFHPNAKCNLLENELILEINKTKISIKFNKNMKGFLETYTYSYEYGHKKKSLKLVIKPSHNNINSSQVQIKKYEQI
jgi:hypothetical protein